MEPTILGGAGQLSDSPFHSTNRIFTVTNIVFGQLIAVDLMNPVPRCMNPEEPRELLAPF